MSRILKKIKDGQEVKISSFDGNLVLTIIGAIRNREEIISRTPILAVHTERFSSYLIKEISHGTTFFVVKSEMCYFLIHQKHTKVIGEDLDNLFSWILEYIHEIGRFEKSDPQLLLKMAVDEGSLVIVPLVDLQKELEYIQEAIKSKQTKSPEELADIILEDTKFVDFAGNTTCLSNFIYYENSQKFIDLLKKTKSEQSIEETIPGRLFIPRIEQRLSEENGGREDFFPGDWDDEPDDPEDEDSGYDDIEVDWDDTEKEMATKLNEKKKLLYQLLENIEI